MGSSLNSYVVGIVGVIGLVGTLKVIGPTKISEFLWFRPPARRQVITNGQQNCADKQIVGNVEPATPATGSVLSLREWPTKTGNLPTIQTIERLKAELEEIGQFVQAKDALKARILKEMTDPEIRNIQAEEIRRLQTRLEKQDQLLQTTAAALSSAEQAAAKRDQLIHDLLTINQQLREEIEQIKAVRRTSADNEQINMLAPSTIVTKANNEQINMLAPPTIVTKADSSSVAEVEESLKINMLVPSTIVTKADNEQINMLAPPTIVTKADSSSVAEVEESLKMANSHIEQAASFIAYSLTNHESPISNNELEDALNKLIGYIGPRLCNDLRSRSEESSTEPYPLITQIALQAGLLSACNHIINNGVPPPDGLTLSRTHSDMLDVGQAVTDVQKAQRHAYTAASQSEALEINQKYLAGIALKLITAVGGSLEGGEDLPPKCREVLNEIVKRCLALHKAISEDMAPMELVTCIVTCGSDFDPSRMEDTEEGENKTEQDTVICTLELGLQCRKRDESGSREEWDVTMKTKVVLASTLEV